MRPAVRVLLVVSLAALAGCAAIGRALKEGDPKTYATARSLVREDKYPEAVAELRRLQVELAPATSGGNGPTIFGELLGDVTRALVVKPLEKAEEAVKRADQRLEAALALAALPDAFRAVEGLPLDQLRNDRYTLKTLTARRAAVEAKGAELAKGAEGQLAMLREDEQAGRVGLALYGWSRFVPASAAQVRERDEKMLSLAKQLFALAGGRFSLEIVKNAPKNLAGGVSDGQARAQNRLATVSFTSPADADVVAVIGASAPKVKRTSGDARLEWKYPTGKREVDNPDYGKLQKKIAELEKEAAWQKGKYDSTSCGVGGSVKGRTKFPAGECAKAYYQAWQKKSKDADAARKSLSRTKARKTETVYSIHPYTAREDVLVVEQTLTTELRYKDGRPPEKLTRPVTLTLKAYQHPAHAPVKLPARAEKLAPDEVAIGMLRAQLAEQVFTIVQAAQKGLLAKFDKERETSKDERVIGEALLRYGAQSMFDSWNRDYLDRSQKERFGKPFGDAPKMDELFKRGVTAGHWDRLTAFAAGEEEAKRFASAYAAWVLTPTYDDATKAKREERVASLKARLAEDRALAFEARAEQAAGGVVEKLSAMLSPLPGFPKAAGAPRLKISVAGPAPKIARTSADVELDQEYVVGEEVVENPEYVEREATRQACLESGDPVCALMWEMTPSTSLPETIKQQTKETKSYAARRDAAELSSALAVKAVVDGRELAFEVPVTHVVEAFTHAARPATKLEARAEKLPADAALVAGFEAAAAKAIFDALFDQLHAPGEGAGAVMNAQLLRAIRLKPGRETDRALWEEPVSEGLGIRLVGELGRQLP